MTANRLRNCLPWKGKKRQFVLAIWGIYCGSLYAQSVTLTNSVAAANSAASSVSLYGELSINTVTFGDMVPLYEKNGRLYLRGKDLYAAGMKVSDSDDLISPALISGVSVNWDLSHLRLSLMVPSRLLRNRHLNVLPAYAPLMQSPSLPGVILNYSTYATRVQSDMSTSTWSELGVIGVSNLSVSTSQQTVMDSSGMKTIRLDTTLQRDFPAHALTLSAGDIATSAPDWGRSLRVGGVRLSRNFDLTPYQGTTPVASFVGDSVLPSSVDLYINGVRQASQKVGPGPFTLQAPPLLSGAGQATVVATDINGQIRSWTYDVYGTSRLLREGILDASVESGMLRESRGVKNMDYSGSPLISSTLRYGLNNYLSPQLHLEADRDVRVYSVGSDWKFPALPGVFTAAYQRSETQNEINGFSWMSGYTLTWLPVSIGTTFSSNSATFRDIASYSGAELTSSTSSVFVGLSTAVGGLTTGYVRQKNRYGNATAYQSLGWSLQTGKWGYLSLNYSRQHGEDGNDNVFGMNWSIPLGRRYTTTVSATRRKNDSQLESGITYAPEKYGAPGWHLVRSMNESRQASYQADMTMLTHHGDFSAGFFRTGERGSASTTWASATGSVSLLSQGIFMSDITDNAFALVSTEPAGHVPVMLENRPVGMTDENGLLLVEGLNAFQRNRLSVDPSSLPANFIMNKTRDEVVPGRNGGVAVTFPVQTDSYIQLIIRDESGNDIPPGTSISIAGPSYGNSGEVTRAGYGGMIYMPAPVSGSILSATISSRNCQILLSPVLIAKSKTGPSEVVCKWSGK